MSELVRNDSNASTFNLIKVFKNRYEIYTGPHFVPCDIDYNVALAQGSRARWSIAFYSNTKLNWHSLIFDIIRSSSVLHSVTFGVFKLF